MCVSTSQSMSSWGRKFRCTSFRLLLAPLLLCCGACVELGDFAGSWEGNIASDELVRRGFDADTTMTVELSAVDLISVSGSLTTSDGQFSASKLEQIEYSRGDALSELTFSGDPVRSYLLFCETQSGLPAETAWIVLSLFPEERIELRVMRRNDLFGVFRLDRL
jgi:hypothetical protein